MLFINKDKKGWTEFQFDEMINKFYTEINDMISG